MAREPTFGEEKGAEKEFAAVTRDAEAWMFQSAFPLWSTAGFDDRSRCFHESLTLAGVPTDHPRRAFVQARQIYVFCEAGRLGWQGPWQHVAMCAALYLIEKFLRKDGAIIHAVNVDGSIADARVDLYDQAFALFGLVHVYATCGRAPVFRESARKILAFLQRVRKHPGGGFFEDDDGLQLPLRQNPHMHMLEATLAWLEVDDDSVWRDLADELVNLASSHFIDKGFMCLFEFFNLDWSPLGGRNYAIVEPGHHYEWAWLLSKWSDLRKCAPIPLVWALFLFAERHGRNLKHGLVIHDVDSSGRQLNKTARLWAQTERLRCAVALLDRAPTEHWALLHRSVAESASAIKMYLDVPKTGLWRDKWCTNGFIDESSRASSFYHIVSAYSELLRR